MQRTPWLLLSSLVATSRASCPDPWVSAPSYLNLGCLLFNGTTELLWDEAESYCR